MLHVKTSKASPPPGRAGAHTVLKPLPEVERQDFIHISHDPPDDFYVVHPQHLLQVPVYPSGDNLCHPLGGKEIGYFHGMEEGDIHLFSPHLPFSPQLNDAYLFCKGEPRGDTISVYGDGDFHLLSLQHFLCQVISIFNYLNL
jgi:hypothetical protein